MAEAMKGVTKAMTRMNKNMKLPQMQKTMQGLIASFLIHKIDSTQYCGLTTIYTVTLD